MEIVRVSEEMLDGCAALLRAAFATVAARFHLTEENCPTHGAFLQTDWLRRDRAREARQFAALEGGETVGFVEMLPGEGGVGEINKLAVAPAHRRRGVGAALLERVLDEAALRGQRRARLSIIEENVELRRYYEERGFVHIGTKNWPQLPFTAGYLEHALECSFAEMREEGLAECARMYVAAFNAPPWNDAWTEETAGKRLGQMLHCQDAYGLTLTVNGALAGLFLGAFEQFYDGSTFTLKEFCVARGKAGRGFGSRLLEEGACRVKALGADRLELFTERGGTADFYARRGFETYTHMVMMGKGL